MLPDVGLFAVAGGLGSGAEGDVASRIAIDAVRAALEGGDCARPRGLARLPASVGLPELVAAVECANVCVRTACVDGTNGGLGASFTGILVLEDRVALAHVGNSRAYLWRDGRLLQLTRDHLLVNDLVDAGTITPKQAERSPLRRLLSRAVGDSPCVEVDARLLTVAPGDTLLLASGLHGVVDDLDIAASLLGERDVPGAAARLIDRATDAGALDNVTVVLVCIR